MDDHPSAFEELGPARRSNSGNVVPFAKPRKPSAKTERLIGELGLRYRPSAQADFEEHAASLALLAIDVADVPPDYLEMAVRKWSRESKFMPKASELIALAQQFMVPPGKIDWVQRGNDHLKSIGRFDIHWIRDVNGDLKLEQT